MRSVLAVTKRWMATLNRAFGLALVLGLGACNASAPPPSSADQAESSMAPATAVGPSAEVSAAIKAILAESESGLTRSADERNGLTRLYGPPIESLLWLDTRLQPSPAAREALDALSEAAAEGLDPGDYRAGNLAALGSSLEGSTTVRPEDIAQFELGLSTSMTRYLRHLHRGRVDPKAIGFRVDLPKDEHDYAALVRSAALESKVKDTIASLTPPLVQYRLLREMLPRYRALAADRTLQNFPEEPRRSVKPGETAPSLELLRARLVAQGDLAESGAPLSEGSRYEGDLVEGVKRFQIRHGLEGDGVLGPTTWAMLRVPLSWRLRQIELAMERFRWLPHLGERAFVAVNIPMFRLWGWDSVPPSGAPSFEMGVIVGKALNTQTPVFLEEMKYLIFQPYWNVPRSILEQEILPLLRQDAGYLARQDMEIVDGESDEARPVAPTVENIDRLARGDLRLRQRPGPKNALGEVKFMFPNDENVYLHSTPSPSLFGRARRDFSHGCVRVEDPIGLAEWVLKDQPQWTRKRIQAAMKGKPSQRVALTRPIRVVLYYVTAAVMPKDETIHFAEDIYAHDPRLEQALHAPRKAR